MVILLTSNLEKNLSLKNKYLPLSLFDM